MSSATSTSTWENASKAVVMNATGYNMSDSKIQEISFEPLYDSCLIILAVLIIAINILIPVLFIRNRVLRTKTNMLLVSLAIADLVTGLLGIPMSIACNAFIEFPSLTGLCITAAVTYRFIAVSTIFHIFAITIERYISVSYPFKYVFWVQMSRVRVVIASIWIGSLLMALVQLSWQNFSDFSSEDPIKVKAGIIYNGIGIIVCFLVPLVVMVFIYCRMFMIIRKQLDHMKKLSPSGNNENCKPLSTERRAITIFALMLGIFTMSWLTWYMSIISVYTRNAEIISMPERWYDFFDFLRFSTSFINPLLYTFLKHDFRDALFSLLFSKSKQRKSAEHRTNNANLTMAPLAMLRSKYKSDNSSPEERKILDNV
ncbi:octopamine receptor-like [Actinia tenebrosa]|uniref:Octopamine receptor-like n=1 Tax=Actinia tenebrosa TaxID=6105 RepID=A0A6P8J0P0_ACTTE|nr:octopamine receptor-like [Actinia tenebrosa]XP_031571724.1 octopamine receptor-like [Actinia tenebrosa]XP_031571725.1 octopamine receptor-like [Actinia tenebrosa]XP_031571726.1 octopamine receptor-like [Actinia tenebrosa]XP_031571727.1 octopamine receptor-like [Actinia tenebrosa]